ncbi:hypothetical protein Droror1_Dr00013995 [Drosera rotundifolia]
MTTSSAIHSPHLFFLPKTSCFSITRIPLWLPAAKVECFQGKLEIVESGLDGSLCLKPVATTVLTTMKKKAKDVLTFFLKQQGLSNIVAATAVKKSDQFLEHLVSRLHILHETRFLAERGLTTIEIREAVSPYLEALLAEHGDTLIDMIQRFPHPPPEVESAPRTPALKLDRDLEKRPVSIINSMRPKAMARVSESVPLDDLPPHVVYLVELGLDLEKIRVIIRKFPSFSYYNLERKVKPLVEFLLELGVPESDIPRVLCKGPQICGISLSNNLIPSMKYLEELGVDKQKWSKLILRFPAMLTVSRRKINSIVSFLIEMGLSKETIGKSITRYPNILGSSVEDKMWPAVKYFRSIGVDVAVIGQRCPQTLTLSVEGNLKPMTEFFLEKGYNIEEIVTMIERFGSLYVYSLSKNVKPKWEFFLSMDYPRSELVQFPMYFGFSLEGRIKPRYALMRARGSRWTLSRLLTASHISLCKAMKAMRMENSDC